MTEMVTEEGVSVELMDLRTLDLPGLDVETIGESLNQTGTVVIAEEAAASQSIGSGISASMTKQFFRNLDSPVARVRSLDFPFPVSRVLEQATIMSDEKISRNSRAVA